MKIRHLTKFRLPNNTRHRCEADLTERTLIDSYIYHGDEEPKRCHRHARFEVDGRKYCHLHAGRLALEHILKETGDD